MSEWKKKASEAYLVKLRDPRWQKKRLEVFERDSFTCQFCGDTKSTLHVHHLDYVRGREPWDYSLFYLLTLCEGCHEFERERPNIEAKFLSRLKLAKISAEQLDCIACPSPFGEENYNLIARFFYLLLNADQIKKENILTSIDFIRAMVAERLEGKKDAE